jgi:hypothetical protein
VSGAEATKLSSPLQRRQNAAVLLSSVGAAIAGAGAGRMAGSSPVSLKWAVLVVGVVAHLAGMVGRKRIQHEQNYQLARWERFGYGACWTAIGAVAGYAVFVIL